MKNFAFVIVFLCVVSFGFAHELPEQIMGEGRLTKNAMVTFLLQKNRNLDQRAVDRLIKSYIDEAAYEGVNHDIAFAQMCYHTNYLSFAGTFVKPGTYNYCGLVSRSSSGVAHRFSEREEGVRAHIQHLKAYASRRPLRGELVDPRYKAVKENHGLGSAPTLSGLSYKWAGGDYAQKVRTILTMVYRQENLPAHNRHAYKTRPDF